MKAFVNGGYMTKFGELWNEDLHSLSKEALEGVINCAEIDKEEVEAIYVGNMLSGILDGQEHLGSFFTESGGFRNIPASHLEGACASGGLALHEAIISVLSGRYHTVAVLGIEKMTDYKSEIVFRSLMGAASEDERKIGLTFPGLYAMMARAYMKKYSTRKEELAGPAVKNHYHASLNPKAQFHNMVSLSQVLESSRVADPLTILECSPISDGASAVIISDKRNKKSIEVLASEAATDTLGLAQRKNITGIYATTKAAKEACRYSGLSPQDINIAEVHDCFSIAEIMALEDLGLFEKGRSGKKILKGELTLGTAKNLVVNTSGGLKGAGHPVGATGVKQAVEIFEQLNFLAGERQFSKAKIGLTHNVGGSGATAVVHIFKK